MDFKIVSQYQPTGDQPKAIAKINQLLKNHDQVVLLGATGTGKTFSIAHVIATQQKPTLILAHNKTLAGQLYNELKILFPNNYVEYFVSNFDYYQPEAYLPRSDTFIDKTSKSNAEIEMMRLSTQNSLISQKDVIVVASVAAIYSSQNPDEYKKYSITIEENKTINRNELFKSLVNIGYTRNDYELRQGQFRVKGDIIEISPAWFEFIILRISLFGNQVESLSWIYDPLIHHNKTKSVRKASLFPADDYITSKEHLAKSLISIRDEMKITVQKFNQENKFIEAQRIEQRTKHDLESLEQFAVCPGIENYSRHFDGRQPGERPYTLLDYFGDDWLLIIDESHISIPQIRGMFNTDKSRKETLIKYGFRLPSAIDNRPLNFPEFEKLINKAIFVSATPGDYEIDKKIPIVEQIIRPTGLLDPIIEVRPKANQIEEIISELKNNISRNERVFITTLTIKMSEELTDYLKLKNFKVAYLHNELKTLERLDILMNLRKGKFDVVVGVNLIREGIDLPEVSLVIILDADKEGFLRNKRSLIQTIGRAARNSSGRVIMYADTMTRSMKQAIEETQRRRNIQELHNQKNNITPKTIVKPIGSLMADGVSEKAFSSYLKNKRINKKSKAILVAELQKEMKRAAKDLDFEKAAQLRDAIFEIENN